MNIDENAFLRLRICGVRSGMRLTAAATTANWAESPLAVGSSAIARVITSHDRSAVLPRSLRRLLHSASPVQLRDLRSPTASRLIRSAAMAARHEQIHS